MFAYQATTFDQIVTKARVNRHLSGRSFHSGPPSAEKGDSPGKGETRKEEQVLQLRSQDEPVSICGSGFDCLEHVDDS